MTKIAIKLPKRGLTIDRFNELIKDSAEGMGWKEYDWSISSSGNVLTIMKKEEETVTIGTTTSGSIDITAGASTTGYYYNPETGVVWSAPPGTINTNPNKEEDKLKIVKVI